MPGPKKTPTKILQARGSWRGDTRGGEPEPPAGESEVPEWVLGDARQHWGRIVPMLEGMGIMSPLFSPGLGLLVNSLGRYIEYENVVSKTGPVTTTDKGNEIVNPYWAARNKAWDQVLKALREFGLTPASITSIRTDAADRGDDDDSMETVLKLAGTSA